MVRWQATLLTLASALAACNLIGGIESAQLLCSPDGIHNGAETDIDCGGGCGLCADFQRCQDGEDCANRSCFDEMCTPALCFDGVQNGFESDADCGGTITGECQRCRAGQTCNDSLDCAAVLFFWQFEVEACVFDDEESASGNCLPACCADDCEGCYELFCPDGMEDEWAPCCEDGSGCCNAGCMPGGYGAECDTNADCDDPYDCEEIPGGPSRCV